MPVRERLQGEDIFQAVNNAFALHNFFYGQKDAGHKRCPVRTVVADSQRLTHAAENHFLVGHKARQAYTVDPDSGQIATAGSFHLFQLFNLPPHFPAAGGGNHFCSFNGRS